ncbi:toxin A [Brachyspira innocens]|uniref:Toxin A n=1 Tax=Brachyspira innocens TaxID=13264 RepID=A0ABT8YVU6_9SPIR|nr:toxin A [Brachyspira innocens]MDO6993139.1 toxin A [Brachyspira innocens]MDO7020033.1 toxin A [Brachyspira innocens]
MKLLKFLIIFILYALVILKPLNAQTNMQAGLYIGADLNARFSPYLDGGGKIMLFYRFISDVFPGYIWEGIKTDVGISDHISAEMNRLTFFVNSSISEYFNIDVKVSMLNYYLSYAKRGFVNFNSPSDDFGTNSIANAPKTSNISFEAEATPTFKVSFLRSLFEGRGLTLQAGLTFKYAYNRYGKYYLDYDLLLIRDQNDISYKLDAMLLFDLMPLTVGINYMLAYMNNTKQLWHSIGAYAHFQYEFLNRIYTEVNLKIGQYIAHPQFPATLYFDMNAMITYRII